MGIEKVLPEWRDLEVMLQLLPRSSTGERMNPTPRSGPGERGRGAAPVPPVLVDAGRTRALEDEVGREALHCIRCSACLNVCPVYSRTGGHAYGSVYPGPIGAILAPSWRASTGRPRCHSPPASAALVTRFAPVKIDIPRILVHLRGRVVRERAGTSRGERAAFRLLARVFASRRRYEAAQRLAPLGRGPMARLPVGPLRRWTEVRDLPDPPEQTFRAGGGGAG